MSKSLDIANILRAMEINNTNNNALITSTSQLGNTLDSAAVQSIPMKFFETLDSLPLTNLSIGLQAFVNENRRHYVSNGSGWYNTGYSIGASPYWDSGGEPDAEYDIVDSATPLIVIAKPQDSDTANLINQSFSSDSAQYMATISNDSSVFTFTPKTKTEIATAVAAGNLTDSNGDFIYTFKWSDGVNFISKAATINYNPSGPTEFNPSGISVFPSAHLDLDATHEIIKFNGDGTVLMTWRPYGFTQYFQWWDLTTGYDISTATLNNSKSFDNTSLLGVVGYGTASSGDYRRIQAVDFNANGTKMISGSWDTTNIIGGPQWNQSLQDYNMRYAQWNLSTAYDPTTHGTYPTHYQGSSPSANDDTGVSEDSWDAANTEHTASARSCYRISWEGNGEYVTLSYHGTSGGGWQVIKYDTTTAYDFGSVDFLNPAQVLFKTDFTSNPNYPRWFNDEGTEMWFGEQGSIRKATFSTPWDFSTVSTPSVTALTAQDLKRPSSNSGNNIVGNTYKALHVEPSANKIYVVVEGGYDQSGTYWNNNTYGNGNYAALLQFDLS